MAPLNPNLTS